MSKRFVIVEKSLDLPKNYNNEFGNLQFKHRFKLNTEAIRNYHWIDRISIFNTVDFNFRYTSSKKFSDFMDEIYNWKLIKP